MNQEEKAFIIRAYDKAELAELYSPGRTAAAALQTLYRWMRRNMLLQEELNEAGYNKFRHSFLKHEVAIIVRHLGALGHTLPKEPVVYLERPCCFFKIPCCFTGKVLLFSKNNRTFFTCI